MSAIQARLNGVLGRTSKYEAFLGVRLFFCNSHIHIPMQEFIENIYTSAISSLGRYVFGSEISYNKAPPRLPGLGC